MSGKILIVDDERSIRTALRDTLQREGYLAVSAPSGEEAIRRCRSEAFDLMIADLKMPGISGLELVREVRQIQRDIRTILITAYASVDSAIEALRLGVSDYMVKPFRLSELRYTARRLIEESKGGGKEEVNSVEQQDFRYCFARGGNALAVNGTVTGPPEQREAACEAVRFGARALAIYGEKEGRPVDAVAAAEAISDTLYFEHRSPVNLQCKGYVGGARGRAFIGMKSAQAAGSSPWCGVAPPAAGSFPGLRAAISVTGSAEAESETSTGVMDGSATEFSGPPQASSTISLESDRVDLKHLVEEVGRAVRAAGLDTVRTNDVIAAVNEAVLNSVEHAYGKKGSGSVDVACSAFGGELVATVRDYGRGFDPFAVPGGGGFAAFKRLVDRVAIESTPGGGTTVYLAKAFG